ncbi:MAG: DUF4386 domain-containing protein [Anaerolineales bacterium]|nr:DUF4386 domain-containing protein [Anaerolineales bacterium]
MNSNRKFAVIAGVVFIIATAASLMSTALVPALSSPDTLTQMSAQVNQVAGGALLLLVAAFGSVGIAVALYPVLKERSAGLALGAVVFRTMEAVMYLVGAVCVLSMLSVSQQFATAGGPDRSVLQSLGNALVSLHDHAAVTGVFAFCLGGLLYYALFFQTRLIPRWLSGWGIVAIGLMLLACGLAVLNDRPVTGYALLAAPIGLQEMVLAVWLIVKGFNAPATTPVGAGAAAKKVLSAA